jgi:hypothetical protein
MDYNRIHAECLVRDPMARQPLFQLLFSQSRIDNGPIEIIDEGFLGSNGKSEMEISDRFFSLTPWLV